MTTDLIDVSFAVVGPSAFTWWWIGLLFWCSVVCSIIPTDCKLKPHADSEVPHYVKPTTSSCNIGIGTDYFIRISSIYRIC